MVFASAFDGTRYIDLKFAQHIGIIEKSGLLVKVDVAKKQIADDAARQAEAAAMATRAGGET